MAKYIYILLEHGKVYIHIVREWQSIYTKMYEWLDDTEFHNPLKKVQSYPNDDWMIRKVGWLFWV